MKIKNNILISINEEDIKNGICVIPNGVTIIGNSAFFGCTLLTSIVIPNNVTSIGNSAFYGCSSLTSIVVDENNANYKSIDGNLYSKDGKVLIQYAKGKNETSFVIPNSVTSIGDDAFYKCTLLTSIVIPNNVTSIGKFAFYGCSSLTSIEIPNSVTSISWYAFACCYSLTNIEISNNVTSIEDNAFYDCSSLTSVVIPNSVTSIGEHAFAWCSKLTNVTIPNSVTSIGYDAFYGCKSLTSIVIPNGVTSISQEAFADCSSLTNVTIGNSVMSIGSDAFWACSNLIKEDQQYYYKAFSKDLTCRGFQYEKNKWFEEEKDIKLCKNGFHACKNAFDLFNYYYGKLNEDIVVYKVELDGVSEEKEDDSKVVAKRIKLVKKINSYKELLN